MSTFSSGIMHKLFIILSVVAISSCTTTGDVKKANKLNAENYQLAAENAEKELKGGFLGKLSNSKSTDMYWALQAASARRNLQNYEQSNKWFDLAEKAYKKYNEENVLNKVGSGVASFLVNDKATDYKGEVYDGVMINTYKALNHLATNNFKKARVEFNRAGDRQRRAKNKYAKDIAEKNKELQKKKNVNQTLNSETVKESLKKHYSNLDNFKAYPDFVNPYTTYISGLFYALDNDSIKGASKLKEAAGMTQNPVIEQDLLDLNTKGLNNYAWVIFENGLGAYKEEFNIHLPLFLFPNSSVKYTGVSFPKLKLNPKALDSISVKGKTTANTQKFADMDNVIATEFKKDLPIIQARSIASAIAKTIAQREIEKRAGGIAGLFAAVYQAATTGSDTRIWSALPKEFQVARVEIPDNKKIELNIGGKLKTIDVAGVNNAIINVKLPTATAQPVIEVVKFN
jgi:hypothetical protein